jgi:hypothetical protein
LERRREGGIWVFLLILLSSIRLLADDANCPRYPAAARFEFDQALEPDKAFAAQRRFANNREAAA